MGWYLEGKPKVVNMTHKVATRFKDMTPMLNERPLSRPRMAWLRRQLEDGARPFDWCIGMLDGQGYRVNGQHSSTLLADNPDLITDGMVAVISTYHCDTVQDLADLYARFDNNKSSRSTGDINWSYAASVGGNIADVPKAVINVCVTAICYDRWGISGYQAIDREKRAAIAMDSEGSFILFTHRLKESVTDREWRCLRRAPVVWAILSTWRKNRKDAMKFWQLVATGSGPDNKSADRTLSRHLDQTAVAYGGGVRNDARKVGGIELPEVMYARCIHAWNAWRKGSSTNLKVYKKGDGSPKMPRAI
jgi:hypothetical protein